MKKLRATCYVPTFNAGDTTRGVEVSRALVSAGREGGRDVEVTFVFPPAERNYESQIAAAGFESRRLDLALDEAAVASIMTADHEGGEFVTDLETGRRYVSVFLDDLRAHPPDLAVFGFMPPAGIAAQILGAPSVAFLPFPVHGPWVRRNLVKSVPDELENALTARAPVALRRMVGGAISRAVVHKPFFTQPTFAKAARSLGWSASGSDLFAMLAADVELVNDLPAFYEGQETGANSRITGPLFSKPPDGPLDPNIRELFRGGGPKRVFVSMGSSGEKPYLLAAIDAVSSMDVRAVVIVPPRICSLAEVRAGRTIPNHVYLTDAFVAAHQVNPMADAAVIHGGQGTVQTAVYSATPIVGVGMQVEQSANIDNVALRGAGLRIARRHWTASSVKRALERVLTEPSFKESADRLKRAFDQIDGYREAGRAMWALVEARGL